MNNNNNKKNFYIPTLQELDSYHNSNQEMNMSCNNQPYNQPCNQPSNQPCNQPCNQPSNQPCNQPSNQPSNQIGNQSCNNDNDNNNYVCNSEIFNNNLQVECDTLSNNIMPNASDELQYFLDNSCGMYIVLFPLYVFNLITEIVSSSTFSKSTLSISVDQSFIVEYHQIITVGSKVLTSNTNNRTFNVSSEKCALELEIKGDVLYNLGTTATENTNRVLSKNLVFNSCLELLPYKSPDPCNPYIYQKFIRSVDNTGTLYINYTYTNKAFQILQIIIDVAVINPRPFI